MRLERLRSAIDRVGPPLRRAGRFVRWLWVAVRSTLVVFAYLHPRFGVLFGLALFYLAFVRLHPILSERAIGAIAGACALAAYWVYGLRTLFGVDVVAPFVRRLTPESTDAPERRDAAELASTLESRFERIVETETKLDALGRPTPETLSMTADERRRRATRLLAALEDDWADVSRLASALEGKRRRRESGAETDGWVVTRP